MKNEKRENQERQKKDLGRELVKIFVTALFTSAATCCVWGVQTYFENAREDRYKKMELVQEYVEIMVRYEQTYQMIIDNKQLWTSATLMNEYNRKMGRDNGQIDISEFEEKEELYRKEYREILSEYLGLLSTIDIMIRPNEEISTNAQEAQEALRKGFGFDYDKYQGYFWNQVEARGSTISEEEALIILGEIDQMIEGDCADVFLLYAELYMNNIRALIK